MVALVGGYLLPHKEVSLGANSTISNLTEATSLSQTDTFPVVQSGTTKKVTWNTATTSMKTVLDTVYSPLFSTSAGLASLLSDETGSSGGFVRAGSPTITTPTIADFTNSTHTHANAAGGGQIGLTTGVTGTLPIANGGTGSTTKSSALNALLPEQTGNSGKALTTDGTNASWVLASSGCQSEVYASSSVSQTQTSLVLTFPHSLGVTPSTWRSSFTLYDPDGTASQSFGSGIATTTGTTGGSYVATTNIGATQGANVQLYATSSTQFINAPFSSNSGGVKSGIQGYVSSASNSQSQVTLTINNSSGDGGGNKFSLMFEQCK